MPWVDFIPRCVVFTFHSAGSILALGPELGQPHLLSDLKLLVPGVMGPRGPGPSKKVSAPPQLNSTSIVLEAGTVATHKERSKKNNFSKIKSFSLVMKEI